MKITSVTYRSNRPTVGSKYIHQHVELTAKVGKGESPAKVLEQLKAEVHALLYPELVGLCRRIASASPLVAKKLADLTEADTTPEELFLPEGIMDQIKAMLAG